MSSQRSMFLIFSFTVVANLCTAEFVPVLMWGTHSTAKPVPALHKISQSSFKDIITSELTNNPRIVVFAEQSLSPEDFGRRDRSGHVAFPHIAKVQKTYYSYVQNAIKAAKSTSNSVAEISIERLRENFEIPEAKVIVVNLDDASENEQRFDMLKRHDELIAFIYKRLSTYYDNVLALYTGHHASWIGSGEVQTRKPRSLLATDSQEDTNKFMGNGTILFYTSGNVIAESSTANKSIPLNYTLLPSSNISRILQGTGDATTVRFSFSASNSGYWYLQEVNIDYNGFTLTQTPNGSVYAPLGFSYACGNQTFRNGNISLTFPNFQVEPIFKETYWTKTIKFSDPYHCVGFTTIPIWSGLFVTFILLLIMTFGLTMMMDIKTMDRFDDAKGKTITINTSE